MKQIINITLIERNKGQIEGLPKNPRLVKEKKFNDLVESIKENPEMLEHRGLLVYPHNGKYVTIGGNMRLEACKTAGMKEVWCEILPEDTPIEKLKAYTIIDNASFGEWNFDDLANEWNLDDLIKWGIDMPDFDIKDGEDEEGQEDDFDVEAAIKPEPVSKTGQIWQLGRHRLIVGDATSDLVVTDLMDGRLADLVVTDLMDGRLADLVVTDPPYNVDYEGGTGLKIQNDKMSDSNFLAFLSNAFRAMNINMKPGAAFYIWHADSEGANFRTAAAKELGKVRQCLIWVKNSLVLGRQDYQWKHEPCLYGWKEGAAHFFIDDRSITTVIEDIIDIDSLKKDEMKALLKEMFQGKIATTIIHEDKPFKNEEHPTMKPIKLISRLIRNSSKRGQAVLDTFGGSGTTLIACEQLGRTCYMAEFDPIYADVIIERYEKFTGEKATLVREAEIAEKTV